MLYLASASPRRFKLLKQIGITPTPLLAGEDGLEDVNEDPHAGESPADYVVRLALDKAALGERRMEARTLAPAPVLGADTTVVVDGVIFGKPTDSEDAARMLRALSGRTHEVMTGVAVRHNGRAESMLNVSQVRFRALTEEDISHYIASGEPMGKAGGYAIQGLGGAFASHLAGSHSGVMGLPLYETSVLLSRIGARI